MYSFTTTFSTDNLIINPMSRKKSMQLSSSEIEGESLWVTFQLFLSKVTCYTKS